MCVGGGEGRTLGLCDYVEDKTRNTSIKLLCSATADLKGLYITCKTPALRVIIIIIVNSFRIALFSKQ